MRKAAPAVRLLGTLTFALAAGCSGGVKEVPPRVLTPLAVEPSLYGQKQNSAVAAERPLSTANAEAPVAVTPLTVAETPPAVPVPPPAVALAPPPAVPSQSAVTGTQAVANPPTAGASAPSTPSKPQAAKPAPTPAKPPAGVVASTTTEQSRKTEAPVTVAVAKKPEPQLDLDSLKTRLRDTNAIGMFTKLALKNQMDDLLKKFRAQYQSGQKASVASLRQPYDMLVLKVVACIQENDPTLARMIAGSREAIWGILADPEKFNSLT